MLALALAAITIHADFPGGSLGRVEPVAENHFRCHLAGQTDQDGRNRQANWYFFRIDGAAGREVIVDLVSLPGEYNYRPNRGAVTGDTIPVFRDGEGAAWKHMAGVEYDAAEPRLRLRVRPTGPRFWIAHVPPYTATELDTLRAAFRGNRALRLETIGKSLEGRRIELWTITDPGVPPDSKKVIWLMFRQHAWEAGSSWAGDGAVRWLLSDEGREARRGAIYKILPLCDPDGVAHGGVRFNRKGFDLNRNWDVPDSPSMPEIAAQRHAVLDWAARGGRVDLFLSLHNTETSEYLDGPPGDESLFTALGKRWFELLEKETTFAPTRPFRRSETTTTEGKPGRMTVNQGLYHARQLPAFLMEQRISHNPKLGRLPTIEDRQQFGAGLARTAWLAVRDRD